MESFLKCVCVSAQLTREYFTRELKRHYQGQNNTDVFTSTWNAIMTTVRHQLPLFFLINSTWEQYCPSMSRSYNLLFCSLPSCISVQFDCCGVSGPEDFEESLFRLLNPNKMVPEACCQRNSYLGDVSVEQCVSGSVAFRHNKVTRGNTKHKITKKDATV